MTALGVALVVVVVVLAALAGIAWRYRRWRGRFVRGLFMQSELAETRRGVVEYARWGTAGPCVVVVHGVGMGFDAAKLYAELAQHGYQILGWSRPGHLRTPVESGRDAEAQADLLAALLDQLGLATVAVLGVSGGGPAAIAFAERHPDKLWALSLEAAVSKRYVLDPKVRDSLIGRLFMQRSIQGPASWLVFQLARLWPRAAFLEFASTLCQLSRREVEANLGGFLATATGKRAFLEFMSCTLPMDLRGAGQELDIEIITRLPEQREVGAITAPTLIIHDAFDGDATIDHAEFSKQIIPHAQLEILGEARDGLGHLMFFAAQGEQVERTRLEFFDRHRPDRPAPRA